MKDKVVVITGGASGLGAALAEVLFHEGARIMIADVQVEKAQNLVQQLDNSERIDFEELNVANAEGVERFFAKVLQRWGRVDVLINNAGTDVSKPIREMTAQEWQRVIAVNLTGAFLMTHEAMQHMSKQQAGHIVNITSTAAKRAWPNAAAYHASKWGLLGFSQALFTEARMYHVKVTAVVAGGMRTPFITDRFPEVDQTTLQDPKNVAATIAYILTQPAETVIPEVMVIPLTETSWP